MTGNLMPRISAQQPAELPALPVVDARQGELGARRVCEELALGGAAGCQVALVLHRVTTGMKALRVAPCARCNRAGPLHKQYGSMTSLAGFALHAHLSAGQVRLKVQQAALIVESHCKQEKQCGRDGLDKCLMATAL